MRTDPSQDDTTTTTEPTTSSSETTTTSSTSTTTSTTTTTVSTTSSSATSTTIATTTTTAEPDNSNDSTASLVLALVLLVVGGAVAGTLLWRAYQNARAREALTTRVAKVVSHGRDVVTMLSDAASPSTSTEVPSTVTVDNELVGLLTDVAAARRAARIHDPSALGLLDEVDQATRELVAGEADQARIAALRVAVARTRGWLDGGDDT